MPLTSDIGYNQTFRARRHYVRSPPKTGHRRQNVRLALNSGRKWVREFESGYDPKATLLRRALFVLQSSFSQAE